jgi:hypothetical protein
VLLNLFLAILLREFEDENGSITGGNDLKLDQEKIKT